jgi:hypothetical protein
VRPPPPHREPGSLPQGDVQAGFDWYRRRREQLGGAVPPGELAMLLRQHPDDDGAALRAMIAQWERRAMRVVR